MNSSQRNEICKIYVKPEQSQAVSKNKVTIGDIASVYCRKQEVEKEVKKIEFYSFKKGKDDRQTFSALVLMEKIHQRFHNAEIENMGETDFIVYYEEPNKKRKKWVTVLKIIFVSIVCFVGAGFTMMTYDNDVGVKDLFVSIHTLIMGKAPEGPSIIQLGYAIGIIVGLMVFFNHAASKKLSSEPTPLEVKMRLYEKDVNDSLIIGGDRKGESIDVD